MPFKKIIIAVIGGTILVFGLALLALPGPAILVIPLGLAILATEFVWARRWLRRARGMASKRRTRRTLRAMRIIFLRKWRQSCAWLRRHRKATSTAVPGQLVGEPISTAAKGTLELEHPTAGPSPPVSPPDPPNPLSLKSSDRA